MKLLRALANGDKRGGSLGSKPFEFKRFLNFGTLYGFEADRAAFMSRGFVGVGERAGLGSKLLMLLLRSVSRMGDTKCPLFGETDSESTSAPCPRDANTLSLISEDAAYLCPLSKSVLTGAD